MIGDAKAGNVSSSRIACTVQNITERKQSEETLRVQARTDPLTGIMNRDALLTNLHMCMANRTHAAMAVPYIDLDRFKIVNDMLGHTAGDTSLIEATQRIASAVVTGGLLARFGGDEFLVVCDARATPGSNSLRN